MFKGKSGSAWLLEGLKTCFDPASSYTDRYYAFSVKSEGITIDPDDYPSEEIARQIRTYYPERLDDLRRAVTQALRQWTPDYEEAVACNLIGLSRELEIDIPTGCHPRMHEIYRDISRSENERRAALKLQPR